MSCPKGDQYCLVSCIISPVTQEALVEVNNASKKGCALTIVCGKWKHKQAGTDKYHSRKTEDNHLSWGNAFHTFFKHKTTYPNILKHSTLVCIKIL